MSLQELRQHIDDKRVLLGTLPPMSPLGGLFLSLKKVEQFGLTTWVWQGWTNFAGEVNQLCGKRCHFGYLNLVRSFVRELVGVLWWKLVDDLFSFVKHPRPLVLDTPWCPFRSANEVINVCGGCDFSWWQREYFGGSIFQWLSALLQMFSCDVFQGVLYSHVLCSNRQSGEWQWQKSGRFM